MKSITIHGIDEPLAKLIESRARAERLSINKTVKKLLEESLGIRPRNTGTHQKENLMRSVVCGQIRNYLNLRKIQKN